MSITPSTEPRRRQFTPGPTDIHPDVQEEVARQTLNHTNPDFLRECQEVQRLVQMLFGTNSEFTGVLTASGTGGNEAGPMNFVHPGDRALYVNSGFFSGRLGDMLKRRAPKEVIQLATGFGRTIDPNLFEETLAKYGKGAIASAHVAQIETSAGTEVPEKDLIALGSIATRYEVMLCIDSVCAFGGAPINFDAWNAAYVSACSQKGVNAPPGTAPFSVAPYAMESIRKRKSQGDFPGSLYFDLEENMKYWNHGTYHATPAIQSMYALRRAMEMTIERSGGDLPRMFRQHGINQRALEAGLEELGLINPVPLSRRASVVSVLETPRGVDANDFRRRMLEVTEVRGEKIAGMEFAAGKRDSSREVRVALLGLWSTTDSVYDACDAVGQVLGGSERAIAAAEKYYAGHQAQ